MDHANTELERLRALRNEPVILRLRHIGKSYPIAGSDSTVVALKDIALCEPDGSSDAKTAVMNASSSEDNLPPPFGPIRRGEFVMIRGPSGGGKTTLLNIIGTIDACTEGTIELNDRKIEKDTNENILADTRLKLLGFVFQTFNLIATMTAAENVELPMTLLGKLSNKEMRLRSRQLLALVGLRNRINHLPSELSGGEQQRVTIARSLANNPSLLLLDEPTGDLDTANTIEIMDLLIRINRRTKTTCIMVTHNPDIECYADRILYVNDGCFCKEVFNSVPTCLSLEKYTKYLAEKEKEITGLTHINENASSDLEGTAAAASAGGSMVGPHRGSRANASFIESSNESESDPVRSQREMKSSCSERKVHEMPLFITSQGTSDFSKCPGCFMSFSPMAQRSAARANTLDTLAQPILQRNGDPLRGTAAVPPPSLPAALTEVMHREEKEAEKNV